MVVPRSLNLGHPKKAQMQVNASWYQAIALVPDHPSNVRSTKIVLEYAEHVAALP